MEGFVAAVRRHAERTPRHPAVILARYPAGEAGESALCYADLDRAARCTAVWLSQRYTRGDRALLLYPNGLEFAVAFLGCLYAGLTPVPSPLPETSRTAVDRTWSIAADCQPAVALTDSTNLSAVSARLYQDSLEAVPAFATDALPAVDPDAWRPWPVEDEALVLLQYTSGSTSDPKGVMVSHANLTHNFDVGRRLLGWTGRLTFCSWLPIYHDMGLISMLLMPLYLGGTAILMSPTDFLKHPFGWLRLIDRHGVDASGAPNFAFDLCCRRVTEEQVASLDLSRWRYACNGSEPIDERTLGRFARHFEPAGFRPESLVPGYGMAEATLFVSGTRPAGRPVVTAVNPDALQKNVFEPHPDGQPMVSSGVVRGLDVRVVDPASTAQLPDGAIGEVWIRGDSVARGYWGKPEQSVATFAARLASGEGPFLRTGDLGALHQGELYLAGRIKELIILRGRNLYPQDVEAVVRRLGESVPGLPCCAFSVSAPDEQLVIVQEVRRRGLDDAAFRRLAAAIRAELTSAFAVRVGAVVLARLGTIRRTTSGKIQRSVVRDMFMSDRLLPLHEELEPEVRRRYRRAPQPMGGRK